MKSHFLLECLVLNSSVINLNQIVLCLLCLNNFDLKTGQLASKKKKKSVSWQVFYLGRVEFLQNFYLITRETGKNSVFVLSQKLFALKHG